MSSEVAWLFLISYWVAALMVVSFFYARWNRGFKINFEARRVLRSGPHSPMELIPDQALPAADGWQEPVFEGDEALIELTLLSTSGTRGPASLSGRIGGTQVTIASGRTSRDGSVEQKVVGGLRRGPLFGSDWTLHTGDLVGLFANPVQRFSAMRHVVYPVFTSLHASPRVREVEVSITAPRAGSGTEVFGVREYQPGDALRRIHWRSSARRGELVVREFEPPGVQTLGIICDPAPPSTEAADQIARIAASEAWDCLRGGGRVVLWSPGCAPTRADESRSLWSLLEWLARFPQPEPGGDMPPVTDAVAVTASAAPELIDLLEEVRARGGSVRAWAVGDVDLVVDAPVERAGLTWPL